MKITRRRWREPQIPSKHSVFITTFVFICSALALTVFTTIIDATATATASTFPIQNSDLIK